MDAYKLHKMIIKVYTHIIFKLAVIGGVGGRSAGRDRLSCLFKIKNSIFFSRILAEKAQK